MPAIVASRVERSLASTAKPSPRRGGQGRQQTAEHERYQQGHGGQRRRAHAVEEHPGQRQQQERGGEQRRQRSGEREGIALAVDGAMTSGPLTARTTRRRLGNP